VKLTTHPTSAEIRNTLIYTSTPLIRPHGVVFNQLSTRTALPLLPGYAVHDHECSEVEDARRKLHIENIFEAVEYCGCKRCERVGRTDTDQKSRKHLDCKSIRRWNIEVPKNIRRNRFNPGVGTDKMD
jgi:hypothetical protein